MIAIGKVLKPKGLLGEIKVQILTNKPQTFIDAKLLRIGGKDFKVGKCSLNSGFAFLFLDGINSVEKADELRGKNIEIEQSAIILQPDEILSCDLIGFLILDTHGNKLGTLKDIENYGSSDIFECAGENGYFSFPNEDNFVIETNIQKRQIIVNAEMLEEEVVL